jgi:serine/threonine protein kinase
MAATTAQATYDAYMSNVIRKFGFARRAIGRFMVLAHHPTWSEKKVVIKVQEKGFKYTTQCKEIRNEIDRLLTVDQLSAHPNISKAVESFETSTHIGLVLEYLPGGDVLTHITVAGVLSMAAARIFTKHVCSALDFVHSKGLYHGDVKPDNVMLRSSSEPEENWEFVLVDWEFCSPLSEWKRCGSIFWAAPELLDNDLGATPASDMWSFGATLFACVDGRIPFGEGKTCTEKAQAIHAGTLPLRQKWPTPLKMLLVSCLANSKLERPTAREVMDGPWLLNQ